MCVCVCVLGWEGWGCTDNSEAYSYSFQLLSTLLLCLSNLMFVPPVAIAIRSHYLLEASVYIFTMFFSTVSDCHTNNVMLILSILCKNKTEMTHKIFLSLTQAQTTGKLHYCFICS